MVMRNFDSSNRASRRNPCPICERDSYCMILEDKILCTRVESEKQAPEDMQGWWHPLPGQEWPSYQKGEEMPRKPAPEIAPLAGLAKRDAVYKRLLGLLVLDQGHMEHLTGPKRGLTAEQVKLRGYKSYLGRFEAFLVSELIDAGDLHTVPGFGYIGDRLSTQQCHTPRIMIPILDVAGRIQGFQTMDPNPGDGPKYLWFSGVGNGASIGRPLHVSFPTLDVPKGDLVITEGPLKADIISDRTKTITVAFQGVSAIDFDALLRIVEELKPGRILLALDADRKTNKAVGKAHTRLCEWCEEHGFAYLVADWEIEDGKGLDDLLIVGHRPTWLEPAPQEAPPEIRERVEIERYALASSWSEPTTAREVCNFPDGAWESKFHRAIVRALRRLLAESEDLNTRSIRRQLKAHDPAFLPAWKDLEKWFSANLAELARVQKTAVEEFREEFSRDMAEQWIEMVAAKLRSAGTYRDFYESAYRGLVSIAPGSDDIYEIESLDKIILRRVEQHTSPEGAPEIIIPTGITGLDKAIGGGIRQGGKVLLVGKPGSGKTALAQQIMANASGDGNSSLFMSLEMRKRSIADRAIAQSVQKSLRQTFTEETWNAVRAHAGHYRNVWIDDRPSKGEEFRGRVENWLYKHAETALVVADYAGRAQEKKRNQSTTEAANQIADDWADISDTHDRAFIMLQQPTKEYEKTGVPDNELIRDTNLFQQHADLVIWIHRPAMFRASGIKDDQFTELWITKSRWGGLGQIVNVRFRGETCTIQDWTGPIPGVKEPKKGKGKKAKEQPVEVMAEEHQEILAGVEL